MMRRLLIVPVLVLPLLIGACGGDDGDDAAPATDAPSGGEEAYCTALERYSEASSDVDASSVESVLAAFEELASLHRAAADAAPDEVKEPQERLAAGAEDLVAALQERDPTTLEEFDAAQEDVLEGLTAEYGDLEAETSAVAEYADEQCGVQIAE